MSRTTFSPEYIDRLRAERGALQDAAKELLKWVYTSPSGTGIEVKNARAGGEALTALAALLAKQGVS